MQACKYCKFKTRDFSPVIERVWCVLQPLQKFSLSTGSERPTRSQTANKVPFHHFEEEGYMRDDMVFNYSLTVSKTESD